MSSLQLMYNQPILDIPEFNGIDHPYVLRAKDEKEMEQKLEELRTIVPESVDIVTYSVGYKPDRPAPVFRYFTTISFYDHSSEISKPYLWWTRVFQGSKKEET